MIVKTTNGQHYPEPPGATVRIGSTVVWTYEVRNIGEVPLTNVLVGDDMLPAGVTCPKTELAVGESMTCTATGIAQPCQYKNTAFAKGLTPESEEVFDDDLSYYFGQTNAAITIDKKTNGEDAPAATGPFITVGDPVNWTYLVTNSGDVKLTSIEVVDDRQGSVTCPKTELEPGESMTCTANGTALPGQQTNIATVTGIGPCQEKASAKDQSYYYGVKPDIVIEKLINGEDADDLQNAVVLVSGTIANWSFVVTNTGDVELTGIEVTDSHITSITCPKSTLAPGEAMTCTATAIIGEGEQCDIAKAVGTSPQNKTVESTDTACYKPENPGVQIVKKTNGEDANTPTGPVLLVGAAVQWTYEVTNTGDVTLTKLSVTDDKGVTVTCPKSTLAAGESMTCTASGTAVAGQYANIGTVTGKPPTGGDVTDNDPSHYFGQNPAISIVKKTNGEDANTPPGPLITVGNAVTWTYLVTNTGDVTLTNVAVTDNRGVTVTCPKTTLAPGESMTCTASGTATVGQYSNIGTVTGKPPSGGDVTASDPSHYYGNTPGDQGCTPGYWKNHTGSWPPTGYGSSQSVASVFPEAMRWPALGTSTLLQALGFGGGSGVEGAAEILLRAAVAALLNASHTNVDYPRFAAAVISDVNTALATQNRDTMLALAAQLDADNNLGCPLN